MATTTVLVGGCLFYEYKLSTKAAVAARKRCIAFGYDPVSDQTAQKWFKKFSSGYHSMTGEVRSGRPKIINNEDLKQVGEANSSTTCLELAQRFDVSDERIRLHLHRLGKTLKFSN
ncbi:hypothetical protein Trydic_g5999 [Trypoxylus dichotomus]